MKDRERILHALPIRVFTLIACLACTVSIYGEPVISPAFPGAEGFGRGAVGGRGGSVYHVTNLDDSGPGSFREAVSRPNRTVVFDVSGIIRIKSRIAVSRDITIAGQTAPGDGITVYGNGISFSGADNAIVRFIRFRMGISGDKGKDAVGIARGSNMIFDHVSVSWGRDETFSINGEDGYITIQNSIISQGLHSHSCGGLIQNWGGISILRCLYIDNHTRNPKVKGVNQYVNNVIYNWRAAGYILGGSAAESNANVIQNYFISGPDTGDTPPFTRATESFHLYAENNYYDANRNGVLDGTVVDESVYGPVTWQKQRYDFPLLAAVYLPSTAYKMIVSQGGAWLPGRDDVDRYLTKELTSLGRFGQIISNENQLPTKGPGTLKSRLTPIDTDQDGMPDYWEKSVNGLDFQKKDSNGDVNRNGYTNLEDYLNWLAVPHVRARQGESIMIDLRTYNAGFGDKAIYAVDAQRPDVEISPNGHTLRFTPAKDLTGLATIEYTVTDQEAVPGEIAVLVSPESAESGN